MIRGPSLILIFFYQKYRPDTKILYSPKSNTYLNQQILYQKNESGPNNKGREQKQKLCCTPKKTKTLLRIKKKKNFVGHDKKKSKKTQKTLNPEGFQNDLVLLRWWLSEKLSYTQKLSFSL